MPQPSAKSLPKAGLYELVFAFANDEYWTRGVPHDPFRSASHKDVLNPGIAVSRNNDQIGLTIVSDIK